MDYKYTAYDRIIHITEKLPKDKISEAIEYYLFSYLILIMKLLENLYK